MKTENIFYAHVHLLGEVITLLYTCTPLWYWTVSLINCVLLLSVSWVTPPVTCSDLIVTLIISWCCEQSYQMYTLIALVIGLWAYSLSWADKQWWQSSMDTWLIQWNLFQLHINMAKYSSYSLSVIWHSYWKTWIDVILYRCASRNSVFTLIKLEMETFVIRSSWRLFCSRLHYLIAFDNIDLYLQ